MWAKLCRSAISERGCPNFKTAGRFQNRRHPPRRRSARSLAVADYPVEALSWPRHHSATAHQQCPSSSTVARRKVYTKFFLNVCQSKQWCEARFRSDAGDRKHQAELLRLQGALLLTRAATRKKPGAAEPSTRTEAELPFTESLTVARVQKARLFALRASLSLAHLWAESSGRYQLPPLLRHKGGPDGRRDGRRGCGGRSSAQYDHLQPVAASFDYEIVPLKHAHQHAPQWSFEGFYDAATFRGTPVAHRIMLAQCCENLKDGSAICFDANIICGPLHPNLGTGAIAIKRGDKQSGNRQRNGLSASHRGPPHRKSKSEAERTQRRDILSWSVRAALTAWVSSIHHGTVPTSAVPGAEEVECSRTGDREGPTHLPSPLGASKGPLEEQSHPASCEQSSVGVGV